MHLLIEVDLQFGVHHLVKLLKGSSSFLLRQEFPWRKSRLPTLGMHLRLELHGYNQVAVGKA